jgi:hypothetical protein
MILPSSRRAALVVPLLLAASVTVPRDAAAKPIQPCENPSLLRADEKRLIAAARGVLPPDLQPIVSSPCRWPESAFALITTEKFSEESGVTHWWVSSCSRDTQRWTCRPARFAQEIDTRLVVGGISRRVKISFDGETSLEMARELAFQALTIYVKPAPPLPYCWGIQGQESRWRIFSDSHPLPTGDEGMHLTLRFEKETERVWLGDLVLPDDIQIEIDFPIADGGQSASCWSAWRS